MIRIPSKPKVFFGLSCKAFLNEMAHNVFSVRSPSGPSFLQGNKYLVNSFIHSLIDDDAIIKIC